MLAEAFIVERGVWWNSSQVWEKGNINTGTKSAASMFFSEQ